MPQTASQAALIRWVALGGALPAAPLRVGPGDVEIAQRYIAQIGRRGGVAKHGFGHQFRGSIGRQRRQRRSLIDRQGHWIAVHRGRRRENELRHPSTKDRLQQVAAGGGVVGVIFERVRNRFRHHDRPGEMQDCAAIMVPQHPRHDGHIGNVRFHEIGRFGDQFPHAGDKIIDDDHAPAARQQRQCGVAADIPGAAGNQNTIRRHATPVHANRLQTDAAARYLRASIAYSVRASWIGPNGLPASRIFRKTFFASLSRPALARAAAK